jgi:ATP-binding cassette subfamily B protein
LGTVYEITQSAGVTLDRLEACSPAPPGGGRRRPPRGPEDIVFRNVGFAYGQTPVLDNVSFTIPAKRTTVFVGPSGAGKTTILRLIARFWDADSGEILIGGTPVRELRAEALFDRLTMVFQDVYLFQGTIRDNIAFGATNATDEAVPAAARAARCHDFILALPDGYATGLGEGGRHAVSGRKAEHLHRPRDAQDAVHLLLDEATASVDPDNESQIQDAINAWSAPRPWSWSPTGWRPSPGRTRSWSWTAKGG